MAPVRQDRPRTNHPYYQEYIMTQLMTAVHSFVDDEEGITAIEYGLIAAVMAIVIAAGFGTIKTNMSTLFTKIGTALSATT